jgi:hypothetical protein
MGEGRSPQRKKRKVTEERSPSRQVKRAEARAAKRTKHRREEELKRARRLDLLIVIPTTLFSLISVALTVVAWTNDVRAFHAVANPALYCWVILCTACASGLWLTANLSRKGVMIPGYFLTALVMGCLGGIGALVPSWHVLMKNEADTPVPIPAAPLDLRNRVIEDRSFAEMNLQGSNFSGATLRHVDFSNANLSESDLRNARLEDVDLSNVELCGSDLRGADLRGARGLKAVEDWSYVFYDRKTRLPASEDYLLFTIPGPIPDTGRDLLYMCTRDTTRRIEA